MQVHELGRSIQNNNMKEKESKMKKNLGVVQAVYPMPVLMVAAYDETGKVNVMNAAWGMICNEDRIALFIDEDHKTTQNI